MLLFCCLCWRAALLVFIWTCWNQGTEPCNMQSSFSFICWNRHRVRTQSHISVSSTRQNERTDLCIEFFIRNSSLFCFALQAKAKFSGKKNRSKEANCNNMKNKFMKLYTYDFAAYFVIWKIVETFWHRSPESHRIETQFYRNVWSNRRPISYFLKLSVENWKRHLFQFYRWFDLNSIDSTCSTDTRISRWAIAGLWKTR